MKQFIYSFVRKFGVRVILHDKCYKGILDVYCVDWVGRDGKYYSLFVPCNESQIFTSEIKLLGGCNGACNLAANLRIFSGKADWVAGRWKMPDVERFRQGLAHELAALETPVVREGGYSLSAVFRVFRPVLLMNILYAYNGEYAGTFTVVYGQAADVEARCAEQAVFLGKVISALGITGCRVVHLYGQCGEGGCW